MALPQQTQVAVRSLQVSSSGEDRGFTKRSRLSGGFKGIIKEMALLKDLYDYTKYVDEVDGTEKVLQYTSHQREAWKQYGKVKKIPEKDAIKIGKLAELKDYTSYAPLNDANGPPSKIVVGSAGHWLLNRTMWKRIPKGLWLAYMEENRLLTNLTWVLIGVIAGNIGTIAKFVSSHL